MEQPPIDAVFDNGMFRPLDPVRVPVREGDQVRLHIEESTGITSLDLALRVYDGLTPDEIAEIEQVSLQRINFFGVRESDR